jgi:hypothetical protein
MQMVERPRQRRFSSVGAAFTAGHSAGIPKYLEIRLDQRLDRAGMLPARFAFDHQSDRQGGRQVRGPLTLRARDVPSTSNAGDTRIWRTNGFDCSFV